MAKTDSGVADADGGVDSGVVSRDGGPRDASAGSADSGPRPDGGFPSCTQNTECSGNNAVCATVDQDFNIVACNGGANCSCVNGCRFETPAMGCAPNQRCAFAGEASTIPGRGFCVGGSGGGAQAANCTTTFNNQGQATDDTCEVGLECRGTSPRATSAKCAQLCDPANMNTCSALGNYTCIPVAPGATVGNCLSPRPNYTDIGQTCTPAGQNMNCASGGCLPLDEMPVVNSCSALCSGVDSCPAGSFCAGSVCIHECATGGSTACQAKNPGTACHQFGSGLALCLPKCATNQDCLGRAQTCNVATGECR